MFGGLLGGKSPQNENLARVDDLKKYMSSVLKGFVDYPEDASIEAEQTETLVVLRARVAKSDMGKVIGKQGKMAQALRTLLVAASSRNKLRATMEIVE